MKTRHSEEVSQGERFQFGANWEAFLSTLNEDRILEAEHSLRDKLGIDNLAGKNFLDIGSGSGLFSLAAKRLGAKVHSFDYDPKSVKCTNELKKRYYPNDNNWIIEEGSVLDREYLTSLGKFDVVYSWGVLHHTGNMVQALDNAIIPVSNKGILFIAIYNDQGFLSKFWNIIKKIYCSNWPGKILISSVFIPVFILMSMVIGIIKDRNIIGQFSNYRKKRGMSIYHDWIDWLGGYPFEVAKPEDIFNFFKNYGFVLDHLTTTNGMGCNQFVFRKLTNVT